jgi:hypothetical protein
MLFSNKGKVHPRIGHEGPGESRGTLYCFFKLSARWGVSGQRHFPATFPLGETWYPLLQEAGWAPWLVWTGVQNLIPTGILSPDSPAQRELLY